MIRLITVGASVVAIIACGQTAWGADLPGAPIPYQLPQVSSAPFAIWTGCFVGGNGGVSWARDSFKATSGTTTPISLSKSAQGMAFGGQIGCDYQVGNWVIGIQGMGDGTPALKTSFPNIPGEPVIQEHWIASATGRLGYAVAPAFLPFIRGGLAWADQQPTGWTAGAGVEWKCLPNLSAFIEYDYLGFSNKNFTTLPIAGVPALQVNSTLNVQTVLVGLNYRFYIGEQVTTRY